MCFVSQKKQREFEDYIKDKYITAKADFRTLLKETKFITYRWVLEHMGWLDIFTLSPEGMRFQLKCIISWFYF